MKQVYYLIPPSGKPLRIEEGQTLSIGRAFDNAVYLDDPSVSRHHANIRWKNGLMYLCDLGSTNGTRLNEEKLTPEYYYELNYADEIFIGDVRLQVVDENAVIARHLHPDNTPQKTVILSDKKTLSPNSFNTED